jgi:hypothetical protein
MASNGTTVINFGFFPGSIIASVAVTGQSGIVATSIVGAWLIPVATGDHSIDEHRSENIKIFASDIVAGTGFTIYGECQLGTFAYGRWNVAWAWT